METKNPWIRTSLFVEVSRAGREMKILVNDFCDKAKTVSQKLAAFGAQNRARRSGLRKQVENLLPKQLLM